MLKILLKTKKTAAIAIVSVFIVSSFAIAKINGGNGEKVALPESDKKEISLSQINNSHSSITPEAGITHKELSKEAKEKLMAEGYMEKEVTEVSMLVERAVFQLNKIIGTEQYTTSVQITMDEEQKKLQAEKELYKALIEKIDVTKAIQLSLHLKNEFGSYSAVMDEYLLCLQLGLDLETYTKNKKSYEKEKTEKSLGHDMLQIITLAKIEEKLLEKLQSNNQEEVKKEASGKIEKNQETLNKNVLPEEVKPNAPEMPKSAAPNPTADIMKELDDIKSKSRGPSDGHSYIDIYNQ